MRFARVIQAVSIAAAVVYAAVALSVSSAVVVLPPAMTTAGYDTSPG
jgi:hypothetical protein